jgi:hypothetical protein
MEVMILDAAVPLLLHENLLDVPYQALDFWAVGDNRCNGSSPAP